ncbi:MAG: hypothetical protein SH821_02480 [Phototrophicales bacterium]|mgnify:CR=1 FL=1|nr:hypothetical protein [Phototrophicales bacterium]
MKSLYSLLFFVIGIILIGAGILTQAVGVVYATPPRQASQTASVVPPFTDNACLECHINRETLQVLAVEEEVVASISEGPG